MMERKNHKKLKKTSKNGSFSSRKHYFRRSSVKKSYRKGFQHGNRKAGNGFNEDEANKNIQPMKHQIEQQVNSSSEEENDLQLLLSTFKQLEKNVKRQVVESDEDEEEADLTTETKIIEDDDDHLFRDSKQKISHPERNNEKKIQESMDVEETYADRYEDEISDDDNNDDDEHDDPSDPFLCHFNFELDTQMLDAVSSEPPLIKKHHIKWPVLGCLNIMIPEPLPKTSDKEANKKISIEEEKVYAKVGTVPKVIEHINWKKLGVKSQIFNNIANANYKNLEKCGLESSDQLTPLQKELFSVIYKYQDFYFPERSFINSEEIRFVYCLHAINHILKTRLKIVHHSAKLTKKTDVPDKFRDQGLVRPKVLILVPFRDAGLRIVEVLSSILLPDGKANIINKSRFHDEFTGSEIIMPKKNPKPEDYELTFSGNTDDTFRVGIAVTKKSLKLYADFYSADIIIASPLGLRVIIGAEGEPERDFDFLASIEVLILDQADVFLMQNWDHVLHIMDHLHLQPRDAHGVDFSRVRTWSINGWSRFYRQTVVISSVNLPEIASLLSRGCRNYAGRIDVRNPPDVGSVSSVVTQVPQVFHKFFSDNPINSIDGRFEYFIKKILPQYKDSIMNHTLLYVPSYFDFVRIRNFLKKEDINFVQICEYSKEGKIARARDMFFHSDAHFLLYSERFHFFRRPRLKGIRHLIFYQLPTFSHFYSEMCNLMQEANQNQNGGSESNMTVSILYSKFDALRLASVVGFERATRMISSEKNIHMFVTGK